LGRTGPEDCGYLTVWTVIGYGVEIWGWRERDWVEKIQKRYTRWVLEAKDRIPDERRNPEGEI